MEELSRREKLMRKLSNYAGEAPKVGGEEYGFDSDVWEIDKTGEYDINKRFKENLNPEVKNNRWVRKPYTKRWDTPKAIQFLQEHADELENWKGLIQAEASKGNLKPYFAHQALLKEQGLIPADVESIYDVTSDWFKRKNLGGEIDMSDFGLEGSVSSLLEGGLVSHDAFSHAYPEKYFGSVDESNIGLTSVTAAEEARAGMLDEFQIDNEDLDPMDLSELDKEALYADINRKGQAYSFGDSPSDDVLLEANYYRDKYVEELNELAGTSKDPLYKNPYGSFKDPEMDPLVGGEYRPDHTKGVDSINQSFYKGAASRYPEMDAALAKNLVDKSFFPYAEDVSIAEQLQLTPWLSTGEGLKMSDYKGKANRLNQIKDLYKNTYFAVSPDMVAAKVLADNWRGGVVGAGASLLNPEVANRVREDDYLGATHEFGKDVAIGTGTEDGLKGLGGLGMRFAPGFTKAVAPYVGGALNVLGPTVAMAGAFSQGHPNSLTNVVVDKAANTPFGLKVNPETDAGKRAGDFLANQARNVWSKVRGL